MNDFLFSNVGQKIKRIAITIMWIEFIGCLLAGIAIIISALSDLEYFGYWLFLAPFVVLIGCGTAWLSVLLLYAFGELVDKTTQNEENTRGILAHLTSPANPDLPETEDVAISDNYVEESPKESHQCVCGEQFYGFFVLFAANVQTIRPPRLPNRWRTPIAKRRCLTVASAVNVSTATFAPTAAEG